MWYPQGDPFSEYIFILVIEILIIKLNSFPELKTTAILAGEITPLFTEANALTIYKQIILTFGNATNLKLNLQKTKTLIIGNNKDNALLIANRCGFQICQKLTHLGIIADDELNNLSENWDIKLQKNRKLKNKLLLLKPNMTT